MVSSCGHVFCISCKERGMTCHNVVTTCVLWLTHVGPFPKQVAQLHPHLSPQRLVGCASAAAAVTLSTCKSLKISRYAHKIMQQSNSIVTLFPGLPERYRLTIMHGITTGKACSHSSQVVSVPESGTETTSQGRHEADYLGGRGGRSCFGSPFQYSAARHSGLLRLISYSTSHLSDTICRVSFRGGRGGGHSPPLGISLPPLGIFTFPIIQYCEMK